ncbi:MAG: hypothetical protein COA32_01235 [Fluviicola sp.]|nr:MAG: hypothetical protein COA32_01235 [Fluviicola sp.]
MIHEINLSQLEKQSEYQTGLISTADEASYLRPPQNWLEGKGWKDSSTGHSSYVQRPPGYGLVFLLCKSISPNNAFLLLKGIHILAFLFSLIVLPKLLFELTKDRKFALIGMLIFGLLPCFNGFMYYTLTESLSPFVLLLLTHEFILIIRHQRRPFLFGLTIAFLLLLRPQLIIFPLFFVAFLLFKSRKFWWVYLISILPFLMWQVRNYNITGSVSLHPIYSSTNKSIYRPPHEALSNLFRIWEYKSDKFHETVGVLIQDTSTINLNKALENIPEHLTEKVKPVLKDFQYVVYHQKKMFSNENEIMEMPIEREFVSNTNTLREEIISSNKLQYYVKTPVNSTIELLTKSHLNLFVFQKVWRGNVFMETLRYLCLIVINLSLVSLLLLLFFTNTPNYLKLVALGVLCTFVYYVFFQRMNEERYMTPLLPIMYIGLITLIAKTFKRDKKT